jgi:type II secretory pathway component PulJ
MRRSSRHGTGFTLIEMMISLGAGISMLLALTASSASLQKSFYSMQDYADESVAEMRVMDYIGRDLRAANTVTIPTGGQTVSLQLPDIYSSYDVAGNPASNLVTPTIVNGVPQYGDAAKPLVISYFVSGTQLIRQQTIQATGQQNQMVIASNVNDMQMNFTNVGTVMQYQITFAPRYHLGNTSTRPGTVVRGTMSVRAIRFK